MRNMENITDQLNIYLVYRSDPDAGDYQDPDAVIAVAKDETEACKLAQYGDEGYRKGGYPLDPEFPVVIKYLGIAAPDLQSGLLMNSVNGSYRK